MAKNNEKEGWKMCQMFQKTGNYTELGLYT